MTRVQPSEWIDESGHRRYPPPTSFAPLGMRWHDLLFAHWPVDADALARHIPAPLELDTYQGQAYIGLVPFRMSAIRLRPFPGLPGLSAFAEMNVRTYVRCQDRPGVWFFTLDAPHWLAVRVARRTFHLPYRDARIAMKEHADGWIDYHCQRTDAIAPPGEFRGRYRPTDTPVDLSEDSLTRWFTDRYCLYSASRDGRVFRGEIDHAPWPLESAECEIETLRDLWPDGVCVPDVPPILHFSRKIDVIAWLISKVS